MKQKISILAFIIAIAVVAVGLPYGQFAWETLAQYTEPESPEINPDGPGTNAAFNAYLAEIGALDGTFELPVNLTSFVFEDRIEFWGNCVDGVCELIFTLEGVPGNGETLFDSVVDGENITIIAFAGDEEGTFLLNFYEDGVLAQVAIVTYSGGNFVSIG